MIRLVRMTWIALSVLLWGVLDGAVRGVLAGARGLRHLDDRLERGELRPWAEILIAVAMIAAGTGFTWLIVQLWQAAAS